MTNAFHLFLFTPDPGLATSAVSGGVDGIVIDWEHAGKHERQETADTEINEDSIEDLRRMRAQTPATIICRINAIGPTSAREIGDAVQAGADEVLVPMVRGPEDVGIALEYAAGRVRVGILVETVEAVERAAELGRLPLARVYVGLNDLAIERGSGTIFSAVLDGTVERVRRVVRAPFGFAGMTVPGAGDPLPSRLLMGELARLRCTFTFLRRSFRRDVAGRPVQLEVARMREALAAAFARTEHDIARDRDELERRIAELETAAAPAPLRAHG